MGQRLNIEIRRNGNVLANAYYHWSGFTSSSLVLTKRILGNVENIQHQDPIVLAVRLLETTGALMTTAEIAEMRKRGVEEEFKSAVDRSDGLIAISETGMENTRYWEEARVDINLDEKIINFGALRVNSKSSYLAEYEKTEEQHSQLPFTQNDFSRISFSDFNRIADELLKMIDKGTYGLRTEGEKVISFIE